MSALLLDGNRVRGKGLKVSASLRIETGDLSGQTSNSAAAHKGFKPKTLAVSLLIPFRDAAHLEQLMTWSQVIGTGGQRHVYRIVNDTAASFGVSLGEFSDGVTAREDDTLAAWRVSFTLSEKESVPERVETRREPAPVTQQSAPGVPVAEEPDEIEDEPEELSWYEKKLKSLDDWLGD